MSHLHKTRCDFLHVIKPHFKKGFTLIEVIISIALLGIISVAFLYMFSSGLTGIFKSGQNSTSHYTVQNQIESNLSDASSTSANITNTNTTLQLNFSGKTYDITGRKVNANYNYGSRTKILSAFTSH